MLYGGGKYIALTDIAVDILIISEIIAFAAAIIVMLRLLWDFSIRTYY